MTLLYFVLLVGVLIFVHELGHFLLAKLFDVNVLRFSLGFGPKAVGFRAGETEYCVCWIPLGGYVKMLGEDARDEITHEDRQEVPATFPAANLPATSPMAALEDTWLAWVTQPCTSCSPRRAGQGRWRSLGSWSSSGSSCRARRGMKG